MAASRQSVAETIAGILARRPVLEPLLKTFEPLLTARAELPETLKGSLQERLRLPEWGTERASEGTPLLEGASLDGLPLREAAEALLPLLETQVAVQPYAEKLRKFFLGEEGADTASSLKTLAEEALRGDGPALEKRAVGLGVPPEVLLFAFGFMLGAALEALVSASLGSHDAPWDVEGAWMHGYCPVCGSYPSIGYLDRPVFEEKNAYLAGGGGKKHMHCSLCGTDWKFRRGACPSCGKEGSGVMEILREPKDALGERLDWCTKCRTYSPVVDLRERGDTPHLDALALGMLHLDMVAAKKKLHPLNPSFWNTF